MKNKESKRILRHQRIRRNIQGTLQRPRLCVHRSLKNFYAQIVDDVAGKPLFGMSTMSKNLRSKISNNGKVSASTLLGEAFAQEALKRGIKKVSFDRAGYLYHGRVKAFADAARKAGLEF